MIPSSANPVIQAAIADILIKENFEKQIISYDTDDVYYRVDGVEDSKCIKFSYFGNDSENILKHGGEDMLTELYKEYLVEKSEETADMHVTLKIECGDLPKTTKIGKKMDEETADKTREENELIRLKRKEMVEPISNRIAEFKNNFLSAPIRRAMKSAIAKKQLDPVEIKYRANEKYWVVMPENNTVQVYMSVAFEDLNEQKLARLMLLEFTDSQRKVQNAPMISFKEEAPTDLVALFPGLKNEKYSNGFISFKLTEHLHLSGKDLQQPLQFLVSFRSYMRYHLHAMKQALHSKMRERVNTFERVLMNAKRDKAGPKNWRETHGGIQEADRELKEEKKVEEVFVAKK